MQGVIVRQEEFEFVEQVVQVVVRDGVERGGMGRSSRAGLPISSSYW